jgi:hypothetical protein
VPAAALTIAPEVPAAGKWLEQPAFGALSLTSHYPRKSQ